MLHVNFMNETVSDELEMLVSQSVGNNATTSALEDMDSGIFAEPLDDDCNAEQDDCIRNADCCEGNATGLTARQQSDTGLNSLAVHPEQSIVPGTRSHEVEHSDALVAESNIIFTQRSRYAYDLSTSAAQATTALPSSSDNAPSSRDRGSTGGLPNWVYCSPFASLSIEVDDVDKELEPRYVMEVSEILRYVERELQGSTRRKVRSPSGFTTGFGNDVGRSEPASFSRLEALDIFLPPSLLEKLRMSINRALSQRGQDLVGIDELRGIITFHVLCASYGRSAKTVAGRDETGCFLHMGVSAKRYWQVWSALNGFKEKRSTTAGSGTQWTDSSLEDNALISEVEQEIAAINRRLLYVPNAIILSLDDDHLRLSSRVMARLTNLRQVNNPVKALGPVCNAICSAFTSVYIAGHYSRPNEQLSDTWTRLVLLLQGAPTQGALILMADAIFAADRGYNCKQSIELVSNKLGSTCFGTHKRSQDFPCVFGEGPIGKRHKGMVVSEKGCRAIYSVKQKIRSRSSRDKFRPPFTARVSRAELLLCTAITNACCLPLNSHWS